MDTSVFSQKVIISFVLGICIGAGSMWVWVSNNEAMLENITDVDAVTKMTITNTNKNSTVVKEQTSGLSVSIDSVSFEEDGWVAIHEDNNGVPGNILGAQLFVAGDHTNVVVDLLRGTMSDATYYAMLHSENGDRAFNVRNDTPLLGLDGQPIMTAFQTLSE